MYFFGFLLFGTLIGGAVRLLVADRAGRWGISVISGGAGALVGGFLGRHGALRGDLYPAGFVASLLRAFALVATYHAAAAAWRMRMEV